MKRYRWNSVEIKPTGRIPVLVACAQSEADGVVVHVESEEEAIKLGRVREINMGALRLFANDWPNFKRKYGEISDKDRSGLFGILLLGRALTDKDQRVFELAVGRIATGPFADLRRGVVQQQPGIELARELAKGLQGVKLVLWWKDDGKDTTILPGLRCPDIRSALYTMAMFGIEGGAGIGACIVCGEPFVQVRKTRKTCSDKCRYVLHMKKNAMRLMKRRKS